MRPQPKVIIKLGRREKEQKKTLNIDRRRTPIVSYPQEWNDRECSHTCKLSNSSPWLEFYPWRDTTQVPTAAEKRNLVPRPWPSRPTQFCYSAGKRKFTPESLTLVSHSDHPITLLVRDSSSRHQKLPLLFSVVVLCCKNTSSPRASSTWGMVESAWERLFLCWAAILHSHGQWDATSVSVSARERAQPVLIGLSNGDRRMPRPHPCAHRAFASASVPGVGVTAILQFMGKYRDCMISSKELN